MLLIHTIQHGRSLLQSEAAPGLCHNAFLIITICDGMGRIHSINNLPLLIEKNPLQSSI